jgi:hypothetical protein
VPLIVGILPALTFIWHIVNRHFRQGHVCKSIVSEAFDIYITFLALARPTTTLRTFVIATAVRGSRALLSDGGAVGPSANEREKLIP